jgi:hypothetical protein
LLSISPSLGFECGLELPEKYRAKQRLSRAIVVKVRLKLKYNLSLLRQKVNEKF